MTILHRRLTSGFSTTCYPCIHYRMQGCLQRIPGHPTIGKACKYYNSDKVHRLNYNGTKFIPPDK